MATPAFLPVIGCRERRGVPGCCGEPACPNTGVASRGCGAGAWCTLACDIGCEGASAAHWPGKQVCRPLTAGEGGWGVGVQSGLPVTGLFPAPLWGTASGVCPLLVVASCCLAVAQVRVPPTGCFPWTPRAELLRTARPRPAPARACPTLPRKQPKTTLLPADFPVRERSEWLTAALQCCYREGASTHLCPAPRRPGTAPGSGLSASGPARTGQLQLWLGGQGARLALTRP